MKKNMLNGICAAAICIAFNTFTAQAAVATSNESIIGTGYFQDSTSMRRGNSNNSGSSNSNRMNNGNSNRMNKGKAGDRMNSDSTGRMGNMKGKSSGGYKSKGTNKSKMDTTTNK